MQLGDTTSSKAIDWYIHTSFLLPPLWAASQKQMHTSSLASSIHTTSSDYSPASPPCFTLLVLSPTDQIPLVLSTLDCPVFVFFQLRQVHKNFSLKRQMQPPKPEPPYHKRQQQKPCIALLAWCLKINLINVSVFLMIWRCAGFFNLFFALMTFSVLPLVRLGNQLPNYWSHLLLNFHAWPRVRKMTEREKMMEGGNGWRYCSGCCCWGSCGSWGWGWRCRRFIIGLVICGWVEWAWTKALMGVFDEG
jgi:hypothetical protein